MNKNQRIVGFGIILIILVLIFINSSGLGELDNEVSVVLFTALFMLGFTSLLLEHFFTKPSDVLASSISIILLLAPLKDMLPEMGNLYYILLFYCILQFTFSIMSLFLIDKNYSSEHWRNKVAGILKTICIYTGTSKVLYFGLFVATIITYIDADKRIFLILFTYAIGIVLVNPSQLIFDLSKSRKNEFEKQSLGTVVGVNSNNIFLIKLFSDYKKIDYLDPVFFKYKDGNSIEEVYGVILDKFYLEDEQWARVLKDEEFGIKPLNYTKGISKNTVVLLNKESNGFRKDMCGVVVENSTISKVRFYYKSIVKLTEGNLVEIIIHGKTIIYQVIQGNTNVLNLENKNNSSMIIGEAIQLGEWNESDSSFIKYGWVPEMNTPVFKSKSIGEQQEIQGYTKIGCIPDSNYPIYLNLKDTINHHLAVLGVTGCGKSVFTRDLLRKISDDGTKVIVIDFTNEYKDKLKDRKLKKIVCDKGNELLVFSIQDIREEMIKFANQRNEEKISKAEHTVRDIFGCCLKEFLTGEDEFGIFELPDLSNTDETIEYTKWFFKVLFMIAKDRGNYGERVCVVLEEAHTIVPEWNSMGTNDNTSRALVNSIAQIALQGRKYNIGFIVIAQRSANVSKTILTQCNSIISFKVFDTTSKDFIRNYVGKDMADSLSELKNRQAIAVGKSFKSNIPLFFEVPEIVE